MDATLDGLDIGHTPLLNFFFERVIRGASTFFFGFPLNEWMVFTNRATRLQAQRENKRAYTLQLSLQILRKFCVAWPLVQTSSSSLKCLLYILIFTWALSKITAFLEVQIVHQAVMKISLQITSQSWFMIMSSGGRFRFHWNRDSESTVLTEWAFKQKKKWRQVSAYPLLLPSHKIRRACI